MKIFQGIAAAPGISIGEAFIYNTNYKIPDKYPISEYQVEFEVNRFYNALRRTKEDYIRLQEKLVKELNEDEGKILESHILMTQDKALINGVIDKIRADKFNIEWIVYSVVKSLTRTFLNLNDDYLRERAYDMLDLGKKIQQNLLRQKNISLADLDHDAIVIAEDVSVSDTAVMNKKHVLGFAAEVGGKTSHSAILARSLGIPAVLGIENISQTIGSSNQLILDGFSGKVILEPDEKTLEKYILIKEEFDKRNEEYLSLKEVPAITLDGKRIKLKANMEIPEQEIDTVYHYGAEGIGLYRSEFLYLSNKNKSLPTEEQQFLAYKFVLQKFPNNDVTIRTLDLGGDKVISALHKEPNPNLGWRAIRFCLDNIDIFKNQLRALLRASVYGNLKIMLPMISNVTEVTRTMKLIEEVKAELIEHNTPFKEDVPLGIMIETPSAAMLSDKLAEIVDFFSIGSNDLIQYTMATDRGNEKLSQLYQPLNPAVLRLIKITIDNAHKCNVKVSICGEMGSEVYNALVLVGLGIDEISLTPVNILEIKKVIRNINYTDVQKLSEEVLNLRTQEEVVEVITKWFKEYINF